MAWGDPQINSFNLPEPIELWLPKQCDSNPGLNLTLPHLQKLLLCVLFTRKKNQPSCLLVSHIIWTPVIVFDNSFCIEAWGSVRASRSCFGIPSGNCSQPVGLSVGTAKPRERWLSLPTGLWDWQLGKCLPSKWQKRSGPGTNLRNNYKTDPSCNPEDFLHGAMMEINTLGIFLLLWELREAEFN